MNYKMYELNDNDKKLDESFEKRIMLDIYIAHEIASEKDIDRNMLDYIDSSYLSEYLSSIERDKGQLEAIVNSVINKVYYDESKQNYLDIAAELVNKLANKHSLYDENKRTAFETGIWVIADGLNIDIDLDSESSKYKNFILNIVENWKTKDEATQLDYIKRNLNDIVLENMDNIRKSLF